MNHYETSTTVGGHGEIHLAGVPFMPGTEVQIVVSPKAPDALSANDRIAALLATLDRARNREPIGTLRREELYDRDDVH
jgi:hypothetical protein